MQPTAPSQTLVAAYCDQYNIVVPSARALNLGCDRLRVRVSCGPSTGLSGFILVQSWQEASEGDGTPSRTSLQQSNSVTYFALHDWPQ